MRLIITGLSGAGKSTATHALEDMSFFCTDNLPVTMLQSWVSHVPEEYKNAAVCIDVRSSQEPRRLIEHIHKARETHNWKVLFVDASNHVLQRRFSALRRRHPFDSEADLESAIRQEREILAPLRACADLVLDSSDLNPYELSWLVESFWSRQSRVSEDVDWHVQSPVFSVLSFSYQRGLPAEADMVIDLRFLPNPHYQPELAKLTGCDRQIQEFFESFPEVTQARRWVFQWLEFVWPHLKGERKQDFTVAFGCSGGRHRSVYMAEQLAVWARQQLKVEPRVHHRELEKKI